MKEPGEVIETSSEGENKSEIWGGVIDPRVHDEHKFRYLVHALNFMHKFGAARLGVELKIANLATQEDIDRQAIDLFHNPERLGERISVSMSLIDQDHRGLWGHLGLIVEAPTPNVILTASSDMGAANASKEMLLSQTRSYGIVSGDILLRNSSRESYNEVVARGTTEQGGPLKLTGFLAQTVKGDFVDPENARKLEEKARILGLPFVKIELPNRFSQDNLEVSKELGEVTEVFVNYGGRRYILPLGESQEFMIIDPRDETRFINPQEFEGILAHVQTLLAAGQGENLPKDIAETLRENYERADKARRAPRFYYYGKDLQGFNMTIGYGDQEVEYRVGFYVACRVHLSAERAEMRRVLAGGEHYMGSSNEYSVVVGANEIDRLLNENLGLLDPEEAKKIREYYAGVREAVQENYERELKIHRKTGFFQSLKGNSLGSYTGKIPDFLKDLGDPKIKGGYKGSLNLKSLFGK